MIISLCKVLVACWLLVLTSGCPAGNTDTDTGTSNADTGTSDTDSRAPVDAAPDTALADADSSDGAPACTLSQWEATILEKHNTWRSAVDPTAAEMHRLRWDTDIVANAASWISSCDPNWPHSPESARKGVGGYEILGENLSYCAGTGCKDDPSITDGSGIDSYGQGWWKERNDYDWSTNTSAGNTSHYLHMASSNSYAIGCAIKRCSAPGPFGWDGDWWWTICQYGPRGRGYWSDTKPYEAGPGGLIDPPEDVYAKHPGLCR